MKNLILITFLFLILGCEKSSSLDEEKQEQHDLEHKEKGIVREDGTVPRGLCADIDPHRRIIAEFKDEEGIVKMVERCFSNYLIYGGPDHSERLISSLIPCNLPKDFKEDNLEITFSGYLYEVFETEDICAQIFEITEIEFKN